MLSPSLLSFGGLFLSFGLSSRVLARNLGQYFAAPGCQLPAAGGCRRIAPVNQASPFQTLHQAVKLQKELL